MLPQILRPPRYNTPVAALTLDGLGICHFNPGTNPKEWQVAFLRKGHRLMIGVKKVDMEGKIVETTLFPVPIDTSVKHLRFDVTNPSDVHLGEFPEGFFKTASFDRKKGDDSYDYRWVLDLIHEVPHSFNKLLRESERPEPALDKVTIISIPLALFYTKRVTTDSVILARHDQTAQQGFVFGRTNELVGAGLYSTEREATIQLMDVTTNPPTPLPIFPTLPPAPDHVYEISIFNLDARARGKLDARPRDVIDNYVNGDLHLYYTVMDVAPPTKHQLFAPPRGSVRSIDGDCHLVGPGHGGVSLPNFNLTTLIEP